MKCPMCRGRGVTGRMFNPCGHDKDAGPVHVTTPALRIKLKCIGVIRDGPCKRCKGTGQVAE